MARILPQYAINSWDAIPGGILWLCWICFCWFLKALFSSIKLGIHQHLAIETQINSSNIHSSLGAVCVS